MFEDAQLNRNLKLRVASALAAGFGALGVAWFGGLWGRYVLCSLATFFGLLEFARMAFAGRDVPRALYPAFWISASGFLVGAFWLPERAAVVFAIASIVLVTIAVWSARRYKNNSDLLFSIVTANFALIYSALFPWYCFLLVALPDGGRWFLFLLSIVFTGDSFAYFGGRFWGRAKLMQFVSPNKTWAGGLAGLVGSALAGPIVLYFGETPVPVVITVLFSLACGMAAQTGDLLISLVKRVAGVKDSGRLMPGHGGMLDRMDGIFIACPLVYAFATYVGQSGN